MTDTHIHLDKKYKVSDLDKIINESKNFGINKFIIPAIQADTMDGIINILRDDIYFACGVHPTGINDSKINEKYIEHPKCVAIGECGLDYYRVKDEFKQEIQRTVFREQIELSIKYNKPLIIHSRESTKDVISILKEYEGKIRGVVHCFIGDIEFVQLPNFYLGIGGVLTYKSAIDLRNRIKSIPLNRLVLETDGPFLTPEPHKAKINEPKYIDLVIKELSKLTGYSIDNIKAQSKKNVLNLFGI